MIDWNPDNYEDDFKFEIIEEYNPKPPIADWKLKMMYIKSGFVKKLGNSSDINRKPNPKESIEIKFEFTNCNNCKKDTRQILLSDVNNYLIDKTISRTQKFKCNCGKINERTIYGCDKCKKCTVQILVSDIRNKNPESLEELKFWCKIYRCKTCKTFNEIFPDILDDVDDGWVDVK